MEGMSSGKHRVMGLDGSLEGLARARRDANSKTMLGKREGTLASAVGGKRRLYGFTSVPHSDGQLHVAVGVEP
jgi:hypothetical protein